MRGKGKYISSNGNICKADFAYVREMQRTIPHPIYLEMPATNPSSLSIVDGELVLSEEEAKINRTLSSVLFLSGK